MNECNFETKAFGGFDKQQVLDYIAALISEQKAALGEKSAEIGQLHEIIANFEEQSNKANAAMKEGALALAEQENIITQKDEELEKAKKESEAQKALLTALQQKYTSLGEELRLTQAKLGEAQRMLEEKNAENATLAEKAARMQAFEAKQEEIQIRLNELLAKAHAKSEEILRSAREESGRIIASANGVAAATYASCSRLKESVADLRDAVAGLERQLSTPAADFETHLEAVKQAALGEGSATGIMDRFMDENLKTEA